MKKNKNILRLIGFIMMALLAFQTTGFAQEENTETTETPKDRAARPAFESGVVFDAQTTTIPVKNTLEMIIQHRFGTMDNGSSDLWGVWAPSNIRLGMNYSITNRLMVGVGTTKFKKMQDLQAKFTVLQQTRSNRIPITVSLYGNMGIDARAENTFGTNYKFADRFSYFAQLIISRRCNDMLSLQVAPSFTHYNKVDSLYEHDKIGVSVYGRIKFSPQTSFIVGADVPFKIKSIAEYSTFTKPPKANFTAGFEISTSTHAFHIYVASAQGILPQENMMWNQNDFFKGKILLGLNITRLWGF